MSAIIDICNLALSRVGAARIQSLDDNTKAARECTTILPFSRDAVLRSYDWAFARKRLDLALLDETVTGFDYIYKYPTDCICIRKITDINGAMTSIVWDWNTQKYVSSGKIKYEIGVSSDLNTNVVLTNTELAELVYTARVTNANLYDSLFVEALAWKLAADLAMPLLNKPEVQGAFYKNFLFAVSQAQVVSANEEEIKVDDSCSFLKARL
jgi:hypothetical protein